MQLRSATALAKKRPFVKGGSVVNLIKKMFSRPKSRFLVGDRIYSRTTNKVLHLKKEVDINHIKHFRALIEGPNGHSPILLSEEALRDAGYQTSGIETESYSKNVKGLKEWGRMI